MGNQSKLLEKHTVICKGGVQGHSDALEPAIVLGQSGVHLLEWRGAPSHH